MRTLHLPSQTTKLLNLDRIRSRMTLWAVLLFTFVDCKTIQSIQNQHGVMSSLSGFGLNSAACRPPNSKNKPTRVNVIPCIYFDEKRSAHDESVDLPEYALVVVLHEVEVPLHVA